MTFRRGRRWLRQRSTCRPWWATIRRFESFPLRHSSLTVGISWLHSTEGLMTLVGDCGHAALKGIAVNSLFEVCNHQIRVAGRWLRVAALDADKYMFLDDPSTVIEQLTRSPRKRHLF